MSGKIYPFLVVFLAVNIVYGDEPCGKPADIAFLIDSSSSIWAPYFDMQIQFVKELLKRFDIGPNTTQVAALTFSDQVATEFFFNQVKNAEEAMALTQEIKHKNGKSTFTHDALKAMRVDLFSPANGARPNVPKIGILLTDGKSTYGTKTQQEAKLARESGIKILAIGIGLGVNDEELRNVVSPPADNNYFHKNHFEELESVVFQELIGQTACKAAETALSEETTSPESKTTTVGSTSTATTTTTTAATTTTLTTTTKLAYVTPGMPNEQPEKSCQGKEADIVFIVDMSSSILEDDFEEQLHFLSDLVRNFDIDSGKARIGLLTFSDDAKVQFYLNEYQTTEEVSKAILNVESEGGKTNTHFALQKLREEMLTQQHGFRPGIAHICILITDGISTKPSLTVPQAKQVHKSGVDVFAIGVGNMTDAAELKMMASKPEYAFEVKNGYKALAKIKNILAYKTCEVPQADQPAQGCAKVNLVFGLFGIGGDDRQNVGEFIKDVGSAFDLQSGNVQVGLHETCRKSKLAPREFQDSSDFNSTISGAMKRNLFPMLFKIRQSFGFTRNDADRVAVLLISGRVQDMEYAYKQVRYLKFKARVIVVGVGKDIDTEQLKMLASYRDKNVPDISHVLPISEAAYLPKIVKKLHRLMCNA